MSPIPKPPKAKSPVQKAIEQLMLEASKPAAVIIHPSDADEVKNLIEKFVARKSEQTLIVGTGTPTTVSEGPLMKAYREHKEELAGVRASGVWWDEAHVMDKTQLERDLEDSLWMLAQELIPATPENISVHSSHMAGDSNRIRRVAANHVHLLCKCKTALRFNRCVHGIDDQATRCDEEVPVVEAGYANCVLHRNPNTGAEWQPGSRFFRCDFRLDDGSYCTRVAVLADLDGAHWCGQEGHNS